MLHCCLCNVVFLDVLSFDKVIGIIGDCRRLLWSEGFLDVTTKLRTLGMTFISAMRVKLVPDPARVDNTMWSESVLKSISGLQLTSAASRFDRSEDLKFYMQLGHCGVSSFETCGLVLVPTTTSTPANTKLHLAYEFTIFWVYLDRNTRKVSPLPDWFVESHVREAQKIRPRSSRVALRRDSLTSSMVHQNSDVITKSITVSSNMIDQHLHTNYSQYSALVADVMRDSDVSRFSALPFDELELRFFAESGLADELRATVALPSASDRNITAQVVKKNEVLMIMRLNMPDDDRIMHVKSKI